MIAILRTMLVAIAIAASTATGAQGEPSPGDWTQIRGVITAQRDALVGGDGERAFSYAAPAIRQQLGDVAAFMRMVREGYRALVEARYVEFLDGAVIGGDVVQPLRLVLPDGTVLLAIYGMQRQPDGGWRIASCVIAPSTVRSA